jgi:hypothetical protein
MQNNIPDELVRIAALRVNALRRLIALALPGAGTDDRLHAQLAEAESLLRYRLRKFAGDRDHADEGAPPARREQR